MFMPDSVPTARLPRLDSVLIAHRGEPLSYPENSLAGYRAALEAGARFVETDIQLSADLVPVLCHDTSLRRVTGTNLNVITSDFAQFRDLPAACAKDFGDRFAGLHIDTLEGFADLLRQWPDVRAFVEIKPQSFAAFGARAVDAVLERLELVTAQCVIISFEAQVLELVRVKSALPIGWVLPGWSATTRALADRLIPDYLFVNRKRLPVAAEPLWPGAWQWGVYTINDRRQATRCLRRGFRFVLTDCIGAMLRPGSVHDEHGG